MSRKGIKLRPAWEERFRLPTRDDLLNAFNRPQRHLIDVLRTGLLALESVEESLTWRGIPWRWSLSYSQEGESDRAWAYLVPQPAKAVFCLPIAADSLESLPLRKLSRPVRDSIFAATQVGGVYWPQWELVSRTQVDDLFLLARRRHESLLATA